MQGFGDRILSYNEFTHLFNDTFPNRYLISGSDVEKTIKPTYFEETVSFKSHPKSGRPRSATTKENYTAVLLLQSLLKTHMCHVGKSHVIYV